MGRIGRGFRLAGSSWRVPSWRNKALLVLAGALVRLHRPSAADRALRRSDGGFRGSSRPRAAPVNAWLAVFYFRDVGRSRSTSTRPIVAAAMIRLEGRRPRRSGDGLRAATRKLPRILGWAALLEQRGASVLRLGWEEKGGAFIGKIRVIAIVGVAWSVMDALHGAGAPLSSPQLARGGLGEALRADLSARGGASSSSATARSGSRSSSSRSPSSRSSVPDGDGRGPSSGVLLGVVALGALGAIGRRHSPRSSTTAL